MYAYIITLQIISYFKMWLFLTGFYGINNTLLPICDGERGWLFLISTIQWLQTCENKMKKPSQWKSKQLKFQTSIFFFYSFICQSPKGLHWDRMITMTIKENNRDVSGERMQLYVVLQKEIKTRVNVEEEKIILQNGYHCCNCRREH